MKILDYYFLSLDAPGDLNSTNESLMHYMRSGLTTLGN